MSGVRFTKVFRTELGHKYILVECSVIALCLPVVSKISRYKLVCYKQNNDRYEHKTYLSTKLMPCFKTFREIHPWTGGDVRPKFLLIVKMRKTLSGMHEMLIPKRNFDSRVSSGLIISTTTKANGIFFQ